MIEYRAENDEMPTTDTQHQPRDERRGNVVNNWRLPLTAGRTSSLRSLREQARMRPNSQSEFSPKSTWIHLLYRRKQKPVEFVMRRHAVILGAALAWLISIPSAEARLDILVDKATQRMMVIQDGYVRYMWPVSTGRDETATPNGIYTPQRMERNWFSSAYYNSPMPYSIFFHRGYAIHGSYAIDRLGGPASHGCVRLHPHHAALLFDLVQREGPDKTTIEVTDDARPGEPSLPPREIAAERGLEPPPPAIIRARPDGPPLPPREIAAERGFEPPPPGIMRARPDGPYLPPREIAAGRGFEPPPPGIIRVRPDEPPLPPRETAPERRLYPPVPGIIRYRETPDMPELPPPQRGNRLLAARATPRLQPSPPPPPPGRRILIDAKSSANVSPATVSPAYVPPASAPPAVAPPASVPAANVPRASCGTGEANPANESSDCRPKPRIVESKVAESRVAESKTSEGSSPEQAQKAPSFYGFKMLPSSCWSGGASRWRSASSRGTPCR
jgi:lipoprotein-anchoring transpeptidase ErfK/SrfK